MCTYIYMQYTHTQIERARERERERERERDLAETQLDAAKTNGTTRHQHHLTSLQLELAQGLDERAHP